MVNDFDLEKSEPLTTMRGNENVTLTGERCLLVPYRKEYVEKYHNWMEDDVLRWQTASEPLTLEQEYDMQQQWCVDDKKCTFIIIDKQRLLNKEDHSQYIRAAVGDVNLFMNDYYDDKNAEIDIMIAEKEARGQGLAQEALCLMMAYGIQVLHLHSYFAKISEDNKASRDLFERLHYVIKEYSHVFKEYTYGFCLDTSSSCIYTKPLNILPYD